MKMKKTENCIICGKPAIWWHGYIIKKEKFALGYSDVKIISGFCADHGEDLSNNGKEYNEEIMGKCIPLF